MDGPAVGDDEALVAPFSAEDGVDEVIVGAAGNVAESVVGNHNFLHIGLGYQILESRKIGFAKVPLAHHGVVAVAVPLRTGMDGKMLGAGVGLADGSVGRSLQAPYHRHAQLAGEVRVFPVGFHSAAPAGIPENVNIGRPESKSLILTHMTGLHSPPVFHAGLVTDGREHLIHQRLVKRGSHGDGHGKHGGLPVSGHTVEGLVPPVIGRNAQGFDGGGRMHHQRSFLLQGHFGDEFPGLLFGRRDLGV